jgi:GMP synthase-like glutamine amidotransferase
MRALLIANAGDADAGFVGQRFEEYDFSFTHVVREYPNEWPAIDGIDLVVHLGSNWSVYWDDVSRNVAAESELIREAHRRGIPLFGICFGAQIMAHALGGSAERAKKAEIGWHDVIATPTYKVLAGTWMQWHYDTFSAPAGAQVLALSDAGPQAMQVGRSFGTQFHPEANEAIISRWMGGEGAAELAAIDLMPSTLIEQTRSEVERWWIGTWPRLPPRQCRRQSAGVTSSQSSHLSRCAGRSRFSPNVAQVVVFYLDVHLPAVFSHCCLVRTSRRSHCWPAVVGVVIDSPVETWARKIVDIRKRCRPGW